VSKCWKQKKLSWRRDGSSSQAFAQSGAPDCPVRQAGSSELAALGNPPATYGYNSPDCPVYTGLSGEPTVGHAICAGHVAEPTARRRHRTVRCANSSLAANGRLRQLWKEIGHRTCPVRQSTEGKISLPRLLSTAPSCLRAIKGTPRRIEENTKHSYNIPKHQDIDFAHLFHCDSI
jgi:hypothetical protein